jgi:predicted HicB family RNase H-like nuclease
MKYKGYTGIAEFDEDSGVIFGHVIGLRDVITFQGESVTEVTQAFRESVDDYLEFCESRGESPEKPFSGQFVVRIDPATHRALSHAAELEGASLNSLVETILRKSIAEPPGQKPKNFLKSATARALTKVATSRQPSKPADARDKTRKLPSK